MWVVMGIMMGLLDPINQLAERNNSDKRSEFDRSIEVWSHLPKSEVVNISVIIL